MFKEILKVAAGVAVFFAVRAVLPEGIRARLS